MLSPEAQRKYETSVNAPNVEQMLELAKIGVVTAKEQEKLKESSRANNAHLFLAKQIEGYAISEIDDEADYYWSHRFTGRVARTGYRQWSMRIAEAFWVQDESLAEEGTPSKNINDGYRASYVFEWGQDAVNTAFKHVHARALTVADGGQEAARETDFGLKSEGKILFPEKYRPTIHSFNPEIIPSSQAPSEKLQMTWTIASLLSKGDCGRLADDMLRFSQATLLHNES